MNRDEKDAARENVTGVDRAEAVALGALPAEILAGDAQVPVLDVQSAVESAVSQATNNSRQWDRNTLMRACKVTRPIVENDLRGQGKAFTRDEVRTGVRTRVAAYATKYGVAMPSSIVLGTTPLEVVAADVCGSLWEPWTYFMPKPIQDVAKAAQSGNPKASAFLKKLFGKGKGPAAPEAAPATASAPPAAAATTAATAPATTTLGRSFWSNLPRTPGRVARLSQGGSSNYGANNDGSRRRGHKHRKHHHRDGQSYGASQTYNPNLPVSATNVPPSGYNQLSTYNPNLPVSAYNVPPAGYPNTTYNPSLPVSAYNVPPTGYNSAVPQQFISEYQAAHQPASVPTAAYNPYAPPPYNPALPVSATNPLPTYNPALPTSVYNQPPAALTPTTSNYIPGDDYSFGEGKIGSGDSLGAWLHELNPLYWLKSKQERDLVDKERQAWIDNAELQKKNAKKQEVLESGQKAAVAQQAVQAAQARAAEIEAQLKSIETQLTGACSGTNMGTIGPAEIVGFAEIVGRDDSDHRPNPFEDRSTSRRCCSGACQGEESPQPQRRQLERARSDLHQDAEESAPFARGNEQGAHPSRSQ